MENRRRHPRFRTRFDALYLAGREEGAGILVDIARRGARLDETSFRPEVGSKVRLYIFVRPVSPFELVGEVVRHTDSGFAVAIVEDRDEIQEMIDDVAEAVSSG